MSRKTSPVRKNLIELLYVFGRLNAYDAYKHYIKLFSKTTMRNVYYQLERGEVLGEFTAEYVEEQGDYGWGSSATKKYYSLGEQAHPVLNITIKEYFDNINKATKH